MPINVALKDKKLYSMLVMMIMLLLVMIMIILRLYYKLGEEESYRKPLARLPAKGRGVGRGGGRRGRGREPLYL